MTTLVAVLKEAEKDNVTLNYLLKNLRAKSKSVKIAKIDKKNLRFLWIFTALVNHLYFLKNIQMAIMLRQIWRVYTASVYIVMIKITLVLRCFLFGG